MSEVEFYLIPEFKCSKQKPKTHFFFFGKSTTRRCFQQENCFIFQPWQRCIFIFVSLSISLLLVHEKKALLKFRYFKKFKTSELSNLQRKQLFETTITIVHFLFWVDTLFIKLIIREMRPRKQLQKKKFEFINNRKFIKIRKLNHLKKSTLSNFYKTFFCQSTPPMITFFFFSK